jgi:hypothetical protein
VNVYLTTAEAAGFNLHWDDHDVIILQLGGEKSWTVHSASRTAPMYRDAEVNNEPRKRIVWTGTLHDGDVLHIPRGHWHQATRAGHGSGYSLHATFGFVQRTGVDWLAWVADQSREQELFRHDLDRSATYGTLADAVSQLLETYPPDVYLSAREQERPARRRVVTRGVFGPVTDVVCVSDFPPHVHVDASAVTTRTAGKELTFAARAEPALRLLLSGNPVNVEQVRAATGLRADVLARTLLAEGVCAELTPELAAGWAGLCSAAP